VTTTLPVRVPLDEISKQAHEAKFGRAVSGFVTGVLFYAGWIVAKCFRLLWLAVAWCWVAVAKGWQEGRGKQPSRSSLREENDRLRQQIQRLGG
jgi:hypothetical protein